MLGELRVCSSLDRKLTISEISSRPECSEFGYMAIKSSLYFSSGDLWPPLSAQVSSIGKFNAYVVDNPIFVGSSPRAFNCEWILVDSSNIPLATQFLCPRKYTSASDVNRLIYDIDFSRFSPVGLRGVFLSHSSFENYGHFMLQVIPWLHYLLSRCALVCIPMLTKSYQFELLDLFGIPLNFLRQVRMPEIEDNFCFFLEKGIFCETISHFSGFIYLRTVLDQCRRFPKTNNSFSLTNIDGGSGRVFIHRGSATRISNLPEILEIARRFGFVIVNALLSTPFEMYSVLGNAKSVIFDPGASISNLLFAPCGIDVVYFNPLPCKFDHGFWSNVSFTLSWMPLYFRVHNISPSIISTYHHHTFCGQKSYPAELFETILYSLR